MTAWHRVAFEQNLEIYNKMRIIRPVSLEDRSHSVWSMLNTYQASSSSFIILLRVWTPSTILGSGSKHRLSVHHRVWILLRQGTSDSCTNYCVNPLSSQLNREHNSKTDKLGTSGTFCTSIHNYSKWMPTCTTFLFCSSWGDSNWSVVPTTSTAFCLFADLLDFFPGKIRERCAIHNILYHDLIIYSGFIVMN